MEYTADYFLNEIYDLEASGMLADLALSPSLFTHFIAFDESDRKNAIEYITSVLVECYKACHLQIAISHSDHELYGYALLFAHPTERKFPKYLHKIYVKEEYRGNGIGGQILSSLSVNEAKICLLCPSEKVAFYEKYGFHYTQPFEIPKDEKFLLSRGLYSGLCVMNNHSESYGAPIFFLNDSDIKKIIGI